MTEVYGRYPRSGRTAREMAERTGMSIRTAQRWTSEPRAVFEARAAERHRKIRAMYAQGDRSMRAIAADLGISVRAVHYAIHKADPDPN